MSQQIILNISLFLSIPGRVRGYESIWFLGDLFVFNTFNQHYYQQAYDNEDQAYCKYNYEVSAYMNDAKLSIDQNVVSRIRNLMVGATNAQVRFPKIIVMVPDDDIVNYVSDGTTNGIRKPLTKVLEWIMKEHNRIIAAMKDILPKKAKQDTYPHIIWIEPPMHKDMSVKMVKLHEKFGSVLQEVAKYKDGVSVLALKKLWDPEDTNLFVKHSQRFTASGYKKYWDAVDRTVRFCDTTILRRLAKTEFNNSDFKSTSTAFRDPDLRSKYTWHREDRSKNRRSRSPHRSDMNHHRSLYSKF